LRSATGKEHFVRRKNQTSVGGEVKKPTPRKGKGKQGMVAKSTAKSRREEKIIIQTRRVGERGEG